MNHCPGNTRRWAAWLGLPIALALTLTGCPVTESGLVYEADPVPEKPVGPLDPHAPPSENFDLSRWKITLPSGAEVQCPELNDGFTSENEFYTDPETGGMVFRAPNHGGTTENSSYTRTELREMLACTTSAKADENNWTTQDGGTLEATLRVDRVSRTGDSAKVGRLIIGQIHGPDTEVVRLYFHKRPDEAKGRIYVGMDTVENQNSWSPDIVSNDNGGGIALGEVFSYVIRLEGRMLTVTIQPKDRPSFNFSREIDAGYEGLNLYFKAGAYNQNNTGDEGDYAQATFFALLHRHGEGESGSQPRDGDAPTDGGSSFAHLDPSAPPSGNFDLSEWKITLPSGNEVQCAELNEGFTAENVFYTDPETGGMVFRTPNRAGTTENSSYSRTELREMRACNTSAKSDENNWKPEEGGTLRATLRVDHVSVTGESGKVGRVVIGQIHGPSSEPIRLYYRKRPDEAKGRIYAGMDDAENNNSYSPDIVGNTDGGGIALGEVFSYTIRLQGTTLSVDIETKSGEGYTFVDSIDPDYEGQNMYFKAGAYNQNNTGDEDDYVKVTFFRLEKSHP